MNSGGASGVEADAPLLKGDIFRIFPHRKALDLSFLYHLNGRRIVRCRPIQVDQFSNKTKSTSQEELTKILNINTLAAKSKT